ncbi:MAG: prolipoprotein diacylglyceryl transferase [Lachnospiraceae bacterium]|nr:prolipoprotein diacylglyceryl transferase [Lachnospiraceae bacterium]
MNPIAIIIDNRQIHWDVILITLTIPAWFFRAHSLNAGSGGKRLATWFWLPLAVVFGMFSSRMLYWYTHIEQYSSLSDALADRSSTAFSMLGILPGIVLAAVTVRLMQLCKNLPALLDALAPATAMGMGLLYLTDLFNYNCRGKFLVESPSLHHLPFASAVPGAGGEPEYRFATFFISFLVLILIAHLCTNFYYDRRREYGATACMFLLLFSASEFILDSTRYDPEYFPFNGFVSILQIFSGVSILLLGIGWSIRALKKRGFQWYFVLLWLGLAVSMTATGILEYLVQRYSDQHAKIYAFMALSCFAMVVFPYILYTLGRTKPEPETVPETFRLPFFFRARPRLGRINEEKLELIGEEDLERLAD